MSTNLETRSVPFAANRSAGNVHARRTCDRADAGARLLKLFVDMVCGSERAHN